MELYSCHQLQNSVIPNELFPFCLCYTLESLLFFLIFLFSVSPNWGQITPVPGMETAYLERSRGWYLSLAWSVPGTSGKLDRGEEDSDGYMWTSELLPFLPSLRGMYVSRLRRQLPPCSVLYFSLHAQLFTQSRLVLSSACLSIWGSLIPLRSLCSPRFLRGFTCVTHAIDVIVLK